MGDGEQTQTGPDRSEDPARATGEPRAEQARILIVRGGRSEREGGIGDHLGNLLRGAGFRRLRFIDYPILLEPDEKFDLVVIDFDARDPRLQSAALDLRTHQGRLPTVLTITSANESGPPAPGLEETLPRPFRDEEFLARASCMARLEVFRRELRIYQARENTPTAAGPYSDGYDSMTGLYNRSALETALRFEGAASLLILGIDFLDEIYLTYGTEVGDETIARFAEILRKVAWDVEGLYRISEERFAVLDSPGADYNALFEELNARLRREPPRIQGLVIPLSVSGGYASGPAGELPRRAYLAYTRAGTMGGESISTDEHDPAFNEYDFNIRWSQRVQKALKQNEFFPVYQSIRDNSTGRTDGYECLARMRDGSRLVGPTVFLPVIRRLKLCSRLTRIMIDRSFRAAALAGCRISVNLCPEDLGSHKLVDYVANRLRALSLQPQNVTFEVDGPRGDTRAGGALRGLRELGCRVAIDDFGLHNVNLSGTADLRADFIKIDGSFIRGLGDRSHKTDLVRAMTDFAHGCGAKVVAEFVHSRTIQERVIELGIDYSQGFFVGEPTLSPEPNSATV